MNRDEPSTLPEAEEPASGVPRMVPGHKWIRALVDGQVVVDARAFMFVWEIQYWPTSLMRPWGLAHRDVALRARQTAAVPIRRN